VKSLIAGLALVAAAASASFAQPSTVILVRHGENALEPPSDPPLSPAGEKRAQALLKALADAKVGTIVTTNFARTKLTAKPVADSFHVTPFVVSTPNLKAQIDSIVAKVKGARKGSTVLVVGHSNTIPLLIAALGGPKMPDLCDAEYSHLFVLEMGESGNATLIRGNYGATDPPDAGGCRMSR
jgi:broad specificity phosphatase PhoE